MYLLLCGVGYGVECSGGVISVVVLLNDADVAILSPISGGVSYDAEGAKISNAHPLNSAISCPFAPPK